MNRRGIGYNLREVQKCQANGLIYVPFTNRCEVPEVARRIIAEATKRGVGFLNYDGDDEYTDYDFLPAESEAEAGGGDWLGGGAWDWLFNGGGNDYLPPAIGYDYELPAPTPGISAGNPFGRIVEGAWQNIRDFLDYLTNKDAGAVESIDTEEPYKNTSRGQGSTIDYNNGSIANPPGNPTVISAEELQRILPGYCPKGTYHPVNDPLSCVPFPNDDATKKKQAATQRQGQQQQARQQRAQQQQQAKACPKDKQGRQVWRNPRTGQCELVPTCQAGSKFDLTTATCLTAGQRAELYGDSNWFWLIVGGVLFLVLIGKRKSEPEPSTRWKRKARS